MSVVVRVQAPSNIALVKYMGKQDASLNIPANPSISMTLDALCTFTELKWIPASVFRLDWSGLESFEGKTLRPMPLREKDRAKMERHFRRVIEHFGHPVCGHWTVSTGNAFPAGAGIASSASGFAALTLAIAAALGHADASIEELSSLSRQGSGSSCRSFAGPWVRWQGEVATPLESHFEPLSDLVLLVEEGEKTVGSTEAHQRVRTSPRWDGRTERVTDRLGRLEAVLKGGDWQGLTCLAWEEAMDMHDLFHTAEPAFSYWKPQTREILDWLARCGARTGISDHGAVRAAVTLDAGPNVHLLIPQTDELFWVSRLSRTFPNLPVLVDRQGVGARVLSLNREVP